MSKVVADLFNSNDLRAERREFTAGAVIHEQHDHAANIFYIHQGQVRIYQVAADESARLVNTMLRFSHSAAAERHGDSIELHITHDQLAQAVGVARETVSLALTEMRHQNLVRTGRNRVIFNPDALREFSQNCKAQQVA